MHSLAEQHKVHHNQALLVHTLELGGIQVEGDSRVQDNLADKPSNLSLRTLSRETYLDGINKSITTKVSAVNSSTVYLMV